MGVLATFDADAVWADTHVCDGPIGEHLERQGASWGRWNADETAQLQRRFSTRSMERIRLTPDVPDWPQDRRDWTRLHAPDALEVHCVREGTLVVYLRTDTGYLGVLCEAGEWLAVPAGSLRSLNAGETPELDLLVLSSATSAAHARAEGEADGRLPSLDAFVETMLELTGHAADE